MYRRSQTRAFEIDVNRTVTPMLTLAFLLLIYFVVQFAPIASERQLDLNVDLLANAQDGLANGDDRQDKYRITVCSQAGPIDLLTFKVKDLPAEALPNDNLKAELRERLRAIPRPALVIEIEFDKRLMYSEMMWILDLCIEQGFHDVSVWPISGKRD